MIRRLIRKLGYDVVRFPYNKRIFGVFVNTIDNNRIKLLHHYDIDLVLDVGANDGEFGRGLKDNGYLNKIVSFEPLADVFERLKIYANEYPLWDVFNFALGNTDGETSINVAGNSFSSSLLDMGERHLQSAPHSQYVGTQKIKIKKLDSIFSDYCKYTSIYLKLDVQGFERHVLEGAKKSLAHIKAIQTEMSLVELYKGEMAFFDYFEYLKGLGFTLMSVEPGFHDEKTGQLLQLDGIWYR